jgi:hypothetical protein
MPGVNQLTTSWGGASEGTTRTWPSSTILYSIATGTTSPNDFGGPESEGYNAAMMTAWKAGKAVLAFELWDDLIAVNLDRTTATSGKHHHHGIFRHDQRRPHLYASAGLAQLSSAASCSSKRHEQSGLTACNHYAL